MFILDEKYVSITMIKLDSRMRKNGEGVKEADVVFVCLNKRSNPVLYMHFVTRLRPDIPLHILLPESASRDRCTKLRETLFHAIPVHILDKTNVIEPLVSSISQLQREATTV